MAQVTIYIPDDLERELKLRAKRAGRSFSSLVTELARAQLRPAGWPEGFRELFGSWAGDFPVPEDPAPEEIVLEPNPPSPRRRRA